jgi:hypothetical protein
MMTLTTRKGVKSKPMNQKSKEIKPLGVKNPLKQPLIGMKKKESLEVIPH